MNTPTVLLTGYVIFAYTGDTAIYSLGGMADGCDLFGDEESAHIWTNRTFVYACRDEIQARNPEWIFQVKRVRYSIKRNGNGVDHVEVYR